MAKKIRHMGMRIMHEENEKWHKEHHEIDSEQHGVLMKTMGITREQDEKWHRRHQRDLKAITRPRKRAVNPFVIGGGFLRYCTNKGWLIQEGGGRNARYYATYSGKRRLRRFGIII